jgi:hypothetical protein
MKERGFAAQRRNQDGHSCPLAAAGAPPGPVSLYENLILSPLLPDAFARSLKLTMPNGNETAARSRVEVREPGSRPANPDV